MCFFYVFFVCLFFVMSTRLALPGPSHYLWIKLWEMWGSRRENLVIYSTPGTKISQLQHTQKTEGNVSRIWVSLPVEGEFSAEQVETINILYNINCMLSKDFPSDQVLNVFKVRLSSYQELVDFSVSVSYPTSLPGNISVQAASMVWDWHLEIMCCREYITVPEFCLLYIT